MTMEALHAFAGNAAVLTALSLAYLVLSSIGGIGAFPGAIGCLASASVGLAWRHWRGRSRKGVRQSPSWR